ncbi:MAG TPA: hypothetical protein PK514_11835 [Spirochaetota bacterium]|nr:hypothetical protein [Spirochaetota bacterium]
MKKPHDKIVQINWIGKSDQYALVPGYEHNKGIRRIKELGRAKGNCFFAPGVPKGLIDFIYRAVIKLKITNKKLIFSRGQVKKNDLPVLNAVAMCDLDWDCGTSIRIPRLLRYSAVISLKINGDEHLLRLMELIVLRALLQIACPQKSHSWYSDMAAFILAKGWPQFDIEKTPGVFSSK